MSVWSALALGFTYLSPLVAIYALFGLGLATAGPAAIWWIIIVGAGQTPGETVGNGRAMAILFRSSLCWSQDLPAA